MDEFGRLDILVSNAGILIAEEVTDSDAEQVEGSHDGQSLRLLPHRTRTRPRMMKEQRSGVDHPDQLQVGQEGQLQELRLRCRASSAASASPRAWRWRWPRTASG